MTGRGSAAGGSASEASSGEIARIFRREYGRAVAVLVRIFGSIDVAEDAVQDAFTAAVQRWPSSGSRPARPDGLSPLPATGPSTGFGVTPPATTNTPRQPCCMPAPVMPPERHPGTC